MEANDKWILNKLFILKNPRNLKKYGDIRRRETCLSLPHSQVWGWSWALECSQARPGSSQQAQPSPLAAAAAWSQPPGSPRTLNQGSAQQQRALCLQAIGGGLLAWPSVPPSSMLDPWKGGPGLPSLQKPWRSFGYTFTLLRKIREKDSWK